MHITHRHLLSGLLALCVGGTAWAQQEEGTFFGQDATGNWIVGIKGGVLQNQDEGYGDATNVGVVLGYRFSRAIGGIGGSSSIEFEATTSVDDGDFSGTTSTWDADTYALFFTYSTPGTVYFKAKLGGMITNLSTSTGVSSDDTSFAYGAGFGLKLGENAKLEAEYTGSTGDNDLRFISLGGLVEF